MLSGVGDIVGPADTFAHGIAFAQKTAAGVLQLQTDSVAPNLVNEWCSGRLKVFSQYLRVADATPCAFKISDRIQMSDTDIASFGRRVMHFQCGSNWYRVYINDLNRNTILFQRENNVDLIAGQVFIKQKIGLYFEICGIVAIEIKEIRGVWFELTLTYPATLGFWGNGILLEELTEQI